MLLSFNIVLKILNGILFIYVFPPQIVFVLCGHHKILYVHNFSYI